LAAKHYTKNLKIDELAEVYSVKSSCDWAALAVAYYERIDVYTDFATQNIASIRIEYRWVGLTYTDPRELEYTVLIQQANTRPVVSIIATKPEMIMESVSYQSYHFQRFSQSARKSGRHFFISFQ
jgi:hypothetical protein